jgi:hypothetical protein
MKLANHIQEATDKCNSLLPGKKRRSISLTTIILLAIIFIMAVEIVSK